MSDSVPAGSYWEGSYRATHEWLDETEEPVFLVPTGSARITVKPLVR
jgi:hypothetical protein